jgi:hypothetical protein
MKKRKKGRIVVSKSGRRYRKSATAKHGYVLIGKKRKTKKRKASKKYKSINAYFRKW